MFPHDQGISKQASQRLADLENRNADRSGKHIS